MASMQYCRMYPHQFSRMTHDVSLENLSAISEGIDCDNEFTKALIANNNNNIGKATGPGSSENFDMIIRHAEPYQKSIHNRNSWAEGSTSKGVHQTKLSMRPRMGSDADDVVLTSTRRLSESDEVFVKDDVTEAQRRNHDGVILEKARRLKGSRKGRKPRKLPEIPATSPPNRETPATRPTTLERERSLADELFEADPNLKPSIGKSDSFHQHISVDALEDEACPHHVEVEPSTSGRVTPPEDNELKVKAEETTVETPDKDHKEFCDNAEFIDDEPRPQGCLNNSITLSLNGTAKQSKAFLSSRNVLLEEASSPEEETRVLPVAGPSRAAPLLSAGSSSEAGALGCTRRSSSSSSVSFDSDDYDATHRGCHKFVPRHSDEIFIEIGDPLFVDVEADDLWCEGVNLRTGKQGIFPAAYATDLSLLEDENGVRQMKFKMQFLGSIEVNNHKGIEVLTQAIHRVALTRRMTLNTTPPPVCILEINEYGIKMTEKTKKKKKDKDAKDDDKKESIRSRLAKILSRRENAELNHFFALKNIAFCGYHPSNDRYFGFITKHPTHSRFACHVFLGEKSTKVVAEAVGNAFTKFFKEYMAFVHPTEDIYLE